MERPSGTVTFLFTDVEGSTLLWADHTRAMEHALARHDQLMVSALGSHDGYVFSTAGDSFAAAFAWPVDAVAAAVDVQHALASESWEGLPDGLRVRIGLHVGEAHERGDNYFGTEVNLAARVMSAAWGGQILCTEAVVALAEVDSSPLGEHRLRDVLATTSLHQIEAAGLRTDFPPPRTLDRAPSTLPAQRSSFVGRRPEIATVQRLLLDHRLITLTGPGGTGKTRLAVEIAGRERKRLSGGTYFADLAVLEGGEHLDATVARSCLMVTDPSRLPIDQLVDTLEDRRALIVLDNCEHVLDAAAELADRVLAGCSEVAVLATSREPLDLPGEHLHLVGPLDTTRGSEATTLFLERARAAGAADLDHDDPAIDVLCGRLDGIPLAIELAAARTRTVTPGEILARLDQRFDVLAGNRRGTHDRHQTLRATIDWSYDLLDDDERMFFDQLGVFAGTFEPAAAAAVARADEWQAADTIDSLVAKSMVVIQETAEAGRRFRLFDTLRAYASEKLRDRPHDLAMARDAHARHYFTRLADLPASRNISRDLMTEFGPDLDNIRLAFDHAWTPEPSELRATVARGGDAFSFLLTNMGLITEARSRCETVLAAGDLDSFTRGRLLVARALMDATEDGSSAFGPIAADALTFLHPGDGVWAAALGLTSIPLHMFAPEQVVPKLEETRRELEGLEGLDADHDRATLDFYLGGALMNLRDVEVATQVFLRSADLIATVEPTSLLRLWSASGAAIGLTLLGRPNESLELLDEVSPLAGWTDWGVEWAFARSIALAQLGLIEAAREPLRAMGARLGKDSPSPMSGTLVAGFGLLAALEGRTERAAELFEVLTATRSPASTAAVYETLGRLEGWTDDEFATRKVTWALNGVIHQADMDRADYFAHLGRLLRAEVASPSKARLPGAAAGS